MMKRSILVTALVVSMLFVGSLAYCNSSMLPKHPGYPMGDFKDPVVGLSLANDPGETPLGKDESLKQASEFHDEQVMNNSRENRPNVVHDFMEKRGPSSSEVDNS